MSLGGLCEINNDKHSETTVIIYLIFLMLKAVVVVIMVALCFAIFLDSFLYLCLMKIIINIEQAHHEETKCFIFCTVLCTVVLWQRSVIIYQNVIAHPRL